MDRHQVIQIRVSPEEKALIEEKAAELGKPPSAYTRDCALEGSIKRFMESKRAPDRTEKEPLSREKREEITEETHP